jgi:hypothetical protein
MSRLVGDHYKDALEEIQRFEHLGDNWDRDGARGVSGNVCKRAMFFLERTRHHAGTPDVLATPAGGIDMIWRIRLPQGPARVELHVVNQNRAELLVRVEGQRRHLEESVLFDDDRAGKTVLRYLESRVV